MKLPLFVCLALALNLGMGEAVAAPADAWPPETLALFSALPIQDAGRVKPLDTYASFKLLKFRGRRSCPGLDGKRLSAMAWFLDTLFRPEQAQQYATFRVDNSEAIVALGIPVKKKRDYYSYGELTPGRAKLFELGELYLERSAEQRSVVETELITLAMNVREYEDILACAAALRRGIDVSGSKTLQELFPGQNEVRLSGILRKAPSIAAAFMELHQTGSDTEEKAALSAFLRRLEEMGGAAETLAVFPPPGGSKEEIWLTPGGMIRVAFSGEIPMEECVGLLADFERLLDLSGDHAAFGQAAEAFSGAVLTAAQARGEYGKIPLEVTFYRLKLFYYALMCYVAGFLVVSGVWMRPQSRLLHGGAYFAIAAATGLLWAGITLRCIIRGRPPVTTLYETILFVTAVAVSVSLFLEWVHRQGTALSLASILGAAGMFLANKYEVRDGSDTMVSMIAVLDTNFWLATHVTTITIGYAAGLLSGGLAHVFVLGKVFGLRRGDPAFYRNLTRMVYGCLCFSLVFSVLGTVLGGIWANESWGRFWGWDPKENGALMIVLWQLAILHARLDGWIGEYGMNIAAILGAAVVAFSWFGVNMLGVGLHSYGFAGGAYTALLGFYALEAAMAALGGTAWFRERRARPA